MKKVIKLTEECEFPGCHNQATDLVLHQGIFHSGYKCCCAEHTRHYYLIPCAHW